MLLKIYNGVEILVDDEDVDRILAILKKGCEWVYNHRTGGVTGLCIINGKEKRVFLHRVIMNCHDISLDVDHIFHNRIDFRKSELRVCTPQQNTWNRGISKNNTSGITGVDWRKSRKKWRASMERDGKFISLGSFTNKEDAVKARKDAEIKFQGEYRFKEKQ
jgi:AP2 domain.